MNLIWRARCSLRVKLRLQGGKSVQKNLWPFFFFEERPGSPFSVSLSEPSWSSSDPSMSMSSTAIEDWIDAWEEPLYSMLRCGSCCAGNAKVDGGSGTLSLGRLVVIRGSATLLVPTSTPRFWKVCEVGGRGVVGVTTSS